MCPLMYLKNKKKDFNLCLCIMQLQYFSFICLPYRLHFSFYIILLSVLSLTPLLHGRLRGRLGGGARASSTGGTNCSLMSLNMSTCSCPLKVRSDLSSLVTGVWSVCLTPSLHIFRLLLIHLCISMLVIIKQ